MRSRRVKAIATLGLNGFCGHHDHVATHHAAVDAQVQLAQQDIHIPILALNHDHRGSIKVPVHRDRKLAALAMHESQFGFITRLSELPQSYTLYSPLLITETYDIF